VTSDLSRARLTAESVGRACGIPVELDARFREIHAGGWQGLSTDEVREGWPAGFGAVMRGEDVRRGGDGESMQDVLVRVAAALEALLTGLPARECAVVCTHGAAARAMSAWLLGLDLGTAWRVLGGLGNCHWAEFREGRAGWRLQAWNVSSGTVSRPGSSPP
jgi:broad specificity phosphatase PhoE